MLVSDDDFRTMFEALGATKMAQEIGVTKRAVEQRRVRLEDKTGQQVKAPKRTTRLVNQFRPNWIELDVDDGVVLIGSDAHIWPGKVTTAWRAFEKFTKDLQPKIVIMNGDVIDGAKISRHPPINWERQPNLVEEIEAAAALLDNLERLAPPGCELLWPCGNHDCLDDKTEVLTKYGWKKYEEISDDDHVLSLCDDTALWAKIDEKVSFPYLGRMRRIEKTRMSMSVTPNHRILLDRFDWRSCRYEIREYIKADQLPYSFDMPVSGCVKNEGVNLKDDEIRLAAWILTDGSLPRSAAAQIYQSKQKETQEIADLLNRLGLKFSIYTRNREACVICGREAIGEPLPSNTFNIPVCHREYIRRIVPNKQELPAWANHITSEQFAVLLDTLIDGDGVWDGNKENKTCAVLYGIKQFLDSVQAVAVCHGWRSRIKKDTKGGYRLCLAKAKKLRITKPEWFEEFYAGTVWCLRVPTGNFMVRRNGCAFFTGNSRLETRLATVAPEYAKLKGVHLKDHFGDRWRPCYSAIINDDVVVKHRYKGGVHALHNSVLWAGKTMITGHLHSLNVRAFTDYNGTRFGVDTGTLSEPYLPQFQYVEDNPVNWRSGFVVLTFIDGELQWPEVVNVVSEGVVGFRGQHIHV